MSCSVFSPRWVLGCDRVNQRMPGCWHSEPESWSPHPGAAYNPREGRVCTAQLPRPRGGSSDQCGGLCSALPQLPSQVALYRPVNLLGDEASFGSFPFRPLPGAISQINYLLLNPYLGVCFWGNPNQDNIYTAWNRCSLSQW